jgi:branched-chain amino acid transport system substrate-binding protein
LKSWWGSENNTVEEDEQMMPRLNKTVAAVATSALLLMAVPAVGIASASGAASKPTYVIGYEGPLTGGNAQLGLNMVFAVQLAINNANANGKMNFKLKLASYDDQGSGSFSPAQAQAAVANKNLVAVVGPAFSGATRAAEPYYSAAHIATVSPSATAAALATGITNNNFMRVVAGDDVQGVADANFLVKTKSLKSVLVIDDASFYGSGLAGVVNAQAKADGATVTTQSLNQTSSCGGTASSTQYSSAATQIVAANPASIFYGGYYCDLGLLLGALSSAGYKGAIMSGDGSLSTALIAGTSPPSAANNVFLSVAGGGSSTLTGKLATQFKALAHFPAKDAAYAAQAYDATNMVIASLKKAWNSKSTVKKLRPALISQLHKLTFNGVTGKLSFQSNGDLNATTVVDFSQIQNGTIVSIGHS